MAETVGKEHGRRIQRRLPASTRLGDQFDWPGLAQVCRLVRQTRRDGEEQTEIEYAVTSVGRSQADASTLLAWWRSHWSIENRLHWVRDVSLNEHRCQIHRGHAPQNLATLRNSILSLLRFHGHSNIAAGLRACTRNTQRLLAMLGIFKKWIALPANRISLHGLRANAIVAASLYRRS